MAIMNAQLSVEQTFIKQPLVDLSYMKQPLVDQSFIK